MKDTLPILAALMIVCGSHSVLAQTQAQREACEGDVFDLCSEKIPDEDAIEACLRKKWSKVSKECRQVIISYKKKKSKTKGDDAGKVIPQASFD